MRGNQYSDARGPIWHSLRALAGVTMVWVITVHLIGGLTLRGFGIGALDLTIAALYLGRRVGIVRAALWTFGLCILAAALMPPISCGRERAYVAAIKSDLKHLASQEEIRYADQYAYTSSFEDLGFFQSEVSTAIESCTGLAIENCTLGGGDEPLVRRFLLCSCSLSLRG